MCLFKCAKNISSFVLLLSVFVKVLAAEVNIIPKSQWVGAESVGEMDALELPVQRVVICHTASTHCSDEESCAQQARNIQHFHMTQMGFADIAYNFLVGNDGKLYEGRGWAHAGAYARGFNKGSIGVAFVGNFEQILPSTAALEAAKNLITAGVSNGSIAENYKLFGHRQLAVTSSPGNVLYNTIKQWPHWSASIKQQ